METNPDESLSNRKQILTVAWISDFPLEWLPDLPVQLKSLPMQHPLTWQRVLLEEFERNPRLRLHIVILRKQIKNDFRFERNGVIYHVLKVPPGLRAPSFFWLDTFLIKRVLKKIKPDLVHAWGMEKGAATTALRIEYPQIVTLQGLFSWLANAVPDATNYTRFIAVLEKFTLKRIQTVTTESLFAVQYLRGKYPDLNVLQAEHAPNWLFHKIERNPQTRPIRFAYIGTGSYAKGTDLLLLALKRIISEIDFELVLITGSDQSYLQKMKETISSELWNRIIVKTNLCPEEVAKELSTATMLLFPTRADTSPNAVKEAVVAGVPVVASHVGGIPDYVFPDRNGILFPVGDLSGFTEAIRSACAHPLFSRGCVDPATLIKTRDYLSPKRMAENFLWAYQVALTERKENQS